MDAETTQRLTDGKRCRDAAVQMVTELHWSALCLCPPDHVGVGRAHGKSCKSPGKAPFGPWLEYQTRLATEREINAKWTEVPNANVGMAYGPVSGLVGIDIDGPGGETMLAEKSRGDLPTTLEFKTPGGGRRLLYAIPEGVELRTTYEARGASEIRFQAKGAQTVMPPSRHANGGLYEWVHGPETVQAALAPEWLIAELRVGPTTREPRSQQNWDHIAAGVEEGERNSSAAAWIGALLAELRDVKSNHAIALIYRNVQIWNERHDPPLDEDELKKVFTSILKREVAKRETEDLGSIDRYLAEQVDNATRPSPVPLPSSEQATNGHVHAGNGEARGGGSNGTPVEPAIVAAALPPWHLVIVKGDPVEYLLRGEFWLDAPDLKDGYVKLAGGDLMSWQRVRVCVLNQAQVILPSKIVNWANPGGHLDKLLKAATIIHTTPESKRRLYVLGFIYRYLRSATSLPDDGRPASSGRPTLWENGSTIFKVQNLKLAIKRASEDFKHREIMAALEEHDFQGTIIDGSRWWIVSADVVRAIGKATKEDEA